MNTIPSLHGSPPRRHRRAHGSYPSRLLLALVGFSAGPALAQSVDYGALEQVFGEPVTTSATGSPQRATDAPVNMQIISADEIRRSGADNIPDVLQFVSGMQMRRYGFGQAELAMRGYDQQFSPRLLVLINGRQVYLDDYGYTAWAALPVQLDEIRQIEVVKGPNSALFGFNAVGGVINIITYDPRSDDTNVATVRGGTQNDIGASAVTTLRKGRAGLRLSGGINRADEYSTAQLPPQSGPYYHSPHQDAFSADGRFQLNPHIELAAEVTWAEAKNFDVSPAPSFGDDRHRTDSFKLGLNADTAAGLVKLAAYRNTLHYHLSTAAISTAIDQHVDVVQASDLFKLGAAHTLRLGLEYRDNTASSDLVFNGKLGYEAYAANAMWNWRIARAWAFTASARVDHLRFNYAATPLAASRYSASDYNRAQLTAASFNTGLVYQPTDTDTIRLMAVRGLQAPSLLDFGLQVSSDAAGTPLSFIGSPVLKATHVMHYEVGYDRTIAALDSTLRSAVYYQKTSQLLAAALNAPLENAGGGLVAYSQNVGSSRAVGGEIGIKGENAAGLRWSASYAYIAIRDHLIFAALSDSASLLDFRHGSPTSVVDAGLGYSWRQLELDLAGRWQSGFTDYRPAADGTTQPFAVDDYLILNLRLGYRPNPWLTLAVTGEQLNQTRVFEAAGLPIERRAIVSASARF